MKILIITNKNKNEVTSLLSETTIPTYPINGVFTDNVTLLVSDNTSTAEEIDASHVLIANNITDGFAMTDVCTDKAVILMLDALDKTACTDLLLPLQARTKEYNLLLQDAITTETKEDTRLDTSIACPFISYQILEDDKKGLQGAVSEVISLHVNYTNLLKLFINTKHIHATSDLYIKANKCLIAFDVYLFQLFTSLMQSTGVGSIDILNDIFKDNTIDWKIGE